MAVNWRGKTNETPIKNWEVSGQLENEMTRVGLHIATHTGERRCCAGLGEQIRKSALT